MAALQFYLVILLVLAIFDYRVVAVSLADMNRVALTYNTFYDTCSEVTDNTLPESKIAADRMCEQAFFALDRLRFNNCHGWRVPECRLVPGYQYYQCTCLIAMCGPNSIRSNVATPFRDCAPVFWDDEVHKGILPVPTLNFQQCRSPYDDALYYAQLRRAYGNHGQFTEAGTSSGVYPSGGAVGSEYPLLTSGSRLGVVDPNAGCSGEKNGPHECNKCGATFDSVQALFDHKRTYHYVSDYHCYLCDKSYSYKRGYVSHMRLKHPEIAQELKRQKVDPAKGGPEPHVCPFCLRRYNSKNGLLDHLKSHTTDDTTCYICNRIFSTRQSFKYHIQHQHSKESIPEPGKGPTAKWPEKGPYECPECGKKYTFRRGMWDHERSHKLLNTYCIFCDRNFASKTNYKKHTAIRHPEWAAAEKAAETSKYESEYRILCPKCPKRFKSPEGLREHMHYHDGKTQCDECGLVLPRRSTLYSHKKKEHPNSTRKRKEHPK